MYTLSFTFNQLRYALCSMRSAFLVAQKMLIIVTVISLWYSEAKSLSIII